jgi:hypothetical protein
VDQRRESFHPPPLVLVFSGAENTSPRRRFYKAVRVAANKARLPAAGAIGILPWITCFC